MLRRHENIFPIGPRVLCVCRGPLAVNGRGQSINVSGQALRVPFNVSPLRVVRTIAFPQLRRFQKADNKSGKDAVAVKLIFGKLPRIPKAVRFGDFLAGHLQEMQPVTLFGPLQVKPVNGEI